MRDAIVAEARSWLGTPWHHRQMKKGVGVDCVHFPLAVYQSFGKLLDLVMPEYNLTPDGKTLIGMCDRYLERTDKMQEGDLIVVAPDVKAQHMGLLANYKHGGFSMIHACNDRSCRPPRVIETRLMFSRAMKLVCAYRFPGL